MLTEVPPDTATNSETPRGGEPALPTWWVRLLARLPLRLLYGFSSLLGWLSVHVYPYREHVVRENLTKAFPDFDEAQLRAVIGDYYRSFAQMLVEVVKSSGLAPEEFRRRVRVGEPRGRARAARPGSVGAAGRGPPVQLGVDAARACRSSSATRSMPPTSHWWTAGRSGR